MHACDTLYITFLCSALCLDRTPPPQYSKRERQTDRQTDRQRQKERERETETEGERETETKREERQEMREKHSHPDHRQTERETDRNRDKDRQTEIERGDGGGGGDKREPTASFILTSSSLGDSCLTAQALKLQAPCIHFNSLNPFTIHHCHMYTHSGLWTQEQALPWRWTKKKRKQSSNITYSFFIIHKTKDWVFKQTVTHAQLQGQPSF